MAYIYDTAQTRRPATPTRTPPTGSSGTAVPRGTPPTDSSTAGSWFDQHPPGRMPPGQPPFYPTPDGNPPPPPAPSANWNWLGGGFDHTKVSDPNSPSYNHAKYAIGRTFAQFDPHLGVTDKVLKALNDLGFGSFYGSGDALGIRGVTDQGRQAGLDPHEFSGDFIQGFHSPNPLWQYDAYADPQTMAATPPSVSDVSGGDLQAIISGLTGKPTTLGHEAPAAPDLSWLGPLLESFNRAPAPAPAAPAPIVLPTPSGSQPAPTFSGGYVQPGFAEGGSPAGDATRLLSLALPRLLQDPNAVNDPLVRQILSLIGGRA